MTTARPMIPMHPTADARLEELERIERRARHALQRAGFWTENLRAGAAADLRIYAETGDERRKARAQQLTNQADALEDLADILAGRDDAYVAGLDRAGRLPALPA